MRVLPLALPLLALAACSVGPNYKGPETAGAVKPGATFVRADSNVAPAPTVARWWTTMGDPVLDALEARALAASPTIAVAEARLKQARSSLRSERANQLPNINASAIYAHAKVPGVNLNSDDNGNGGSGSLSLYNLGFDASWEVDLWGGKRRGVEAARAQADAAAANVADAQVSLTAEIARTYVSLRDRQQRIRLAEDAVARQRDLLTLTRQRQAQGTASLLDVEQRQAELEQGEGAILPLRADRDGYLNALATLAGEAPGALDAMLATPGAIPLPPASVPVGDPATLLQHRPDIRSAERQLAAATAKIGVAEAARFPTISFMGLIGIGGTSIGDVVDPDKIAAIGLPRLSWNILDFGRNAARVGQAEGTRDEAAAQYRQAVLTALRDSEDALARFGASRQSVASAARSSASAERTAALMREKFAGGTATRLQMLDAERQAIAAAQTQAQATATMTADFIALQKALGLGWE
jgi:NodT family efflux transporter outer membrane factor (OMF) lipoprotein